LAGLARPSRMAVSSEIADEARLRRSSAHFVPFRDLQNTRPRGLRTGRNGTEFARP
jgi:hypothetical protein